MVEDDGLTGVRKGSDRPERFVERFSGDKSSSEAISRAQAADPMRCCFLCREPEDQIAQGVRRRIGLFRWTCRGESNRTG
jgi:hypothetical protein